MRKNLLLLCAALFIAVIAGVSSALADDWSSKTLDLKVINYDLDYTISYSEERLQSACAMTVVNPTDRAISEVPLLLYRLLSVDSILNESGHPLPFAQDVETFEDWSVMQKNFVRVQPPDGVGPHDTIQFTVYYSGHLLGYTETGMRYVRDRIDTAYTILRPDCGAYPTLGYPAWAVNRAAGQQQFNYTVSTTVPRGFVAANGGRLIEKEQSETTTTFRYENIKKAWRIDVAIARYGVLESGKNRIYYFRDDSAGAKRVMTELEDVLDLYTKWWGPLKNYRGFAVIEIPDGWGSQTDVTAILQQASAFTDTEGLHELYHEISHLWNVVSTDPLPCRWEEGLATFSEYLLVDHQTGAQLLDSNCNRYLHYIRDRLSTDSSLVTTPLAEFGKQNMTGYSYTLGMLMFRVLYDLTGPDEFNSIIGETYDRYAETGASTAQFAEVLESSSSAGLERFVDDWIWTTGYQKAVLDAESIGELVAAYR